MSLYTYGATEYTWLCNALCNVIYCVRCVIQVSNYTPIGTGFMSRSCVITSLFQAFILGNVNAVNNVSCVREYILYTPLKNHGSITIP